ncbi:hypothetical protein GIS00_25605 [Nakamurella sp. YIM 132087]|uniref:HAD family hydrolase n=1 Tax=Nakamurella alba TaxID=2665158 RepID=A0A7K1FT30_9ACTN|nr:hypothetical protein [Nakamurella alba]MTD17312.1 hypothetical protein [Nakamurella alba]
MTTVIDLEGVLLGSDLPVQAYARHATEHLDPAAATAVIDGMRDFLEGKGTGLAGALGVDLTGVEDGTEAVTLLARAAGVPDPALAGAHIAAQRDLLASLFVLDPSPALAALPAGEPVWVVSELPPADAAQVVGALDDTGRTERIVTFGELTAAPPAGTWTMVAHCWEGELDRAAALGARTAHLDRFGTGTGSPTWRARTLPDLLAAMAGGAS